MTLKDILAKKSSERTAEEVAYLNACKGEMTAEQKAQLAAESGEGIDLESLKSVIGASAAEAATKAAGIIADSIVSKFMDGVAEKRAETMGGRKAVNTKAGEQTRLFMKALLTGDREAAKALTTDTSGSSPDDAKAGLLIPTELRNEVLRIAETQFGIARRDSFYMPFGGPGNSRTIPVLGTSVSVYWTDEGEAKTSTQPKFNVVQQTLKKLAAIVPMTEEILEDSEIDLTTLIATLFAEAIAKEEDYQFFAGTGAPWTGVLNNADVHQVDAAGAASQLTADDLLDLQDAVPTGAQDGARYYLSRTALSQIRKLKGTDGQYIYQAPSAGLPGTIWDKPYTVSDSFPAIADVEEGDPFVLYGNLAKGTVFGDKKQIRAKLLTEASIHDTDGQTSINLAEQDMVALRIVERVGFVVSLPSALAVLKASAFVS